MNFYVTDLEHFFQLCVTRFVEFWDLSFGIDNFSQKRVLQVTEEGCQESG